MKTQQVNIKNALKLLHVDPDARMTRALAERLEKDCTSRITLARRNNDDASAAKWSEVKAVFTKAKLAQGKCPVCGVRINRNATACQLHQQRPWVKRLEPGMIEKATKPAKVARPNNNARVHRPPEDIHALFGFYSAPVQKVVRAWKKQGESPDLIRDCFCQIAIDLIMERDEIAISNRGGGKWQLFFELGAALSSVMDDKRKPHRWLLQNGISTGAGIPNGPYAIYSWDEIAAEIRRYGGPAFSVASLIKAARRLRILPAQ